MEVIRSIPQLDGLRDEWNALADCHRRPLLRHEWVTCCARVFHHEADLRVAVVRVGGRLVAAAPLALSTEHGLERLVFLGAAALQEPNGFLFDGPTALDALVAGLTRLGLPLQLDRLELESAVVTELPSLLRGRALHFTLATAPALSVPVRSDWERYFQTLSTKVTKNLPRVQARARRLGPVTVECLSPTPDDVDAIMDVVMAVEASGWKGRRGTAMAIKPRLGDFFRQYAAAAAREGSLRVFILKFSGRAAAVEVDVEAYRRLWQLKIGYDESLSGYYPGLQLVQEVIRYAFDRGLEAFEFLGAAAEWEKRWNPEPRQHVTALVYPKTARGLWGMTRDLSTAAGRRAARALASGQPVGEETTPARRGPSAMASNSSPNNRTPGSLEAKRATDGWRRPGSNT